MANLLMAASKQSTNQRRVFRQIDVADETLFPYFSHRVFQGFIEARCRRFNASVVAAESAIKQARPEWKNAWLRTLS